MKRIVLFLSCLFVMGCSGAKAISYTPDILNVTDPIATIKTALEQQPPAYAYVPVKVEVTDQRMTLYMVDSGVPSIFNRGGSTVVPTTYYYKTLGAPKLSSSTKYPIYNVEIYDKIGNCLTWIYTYEEKEAKEFIDALSYMIQNSK